MAYSEVRVKHRLDMNEKQNELKGVLSDTYLNAESIRLLGAKGKQMERLNKKAEEAAKAKTKTSSSLSLLNAAQQAILQGGAALSLFRTVKSILEENASVGELIGLTQSFYQLAHPLNFLGTMYREFKTDYQALCALHEILKQPKSLMENRLDAPPLVIPRSASVKIADVTYKYPSSERRALDKVSMKILGGSKVAIVGPTGSGKSTLVKLIARLMDVEDGTVTICDQDVKAVSMESLRRSIVFVPQDLVLFNDTMRYNLTYGMGDNVTEEQLQEAIIAAQLTKTVQALPKGLDTLVGDRGAFLSGGERQRVSLARAFLRKTKARLIILDEATSSLDVETEKAIYSAIQREFGSQATLVVVAHRLSTIADADQIFVLEDGVIVEKGNHLELLERKDGRYAALWKYQQTRGVAAYEVTKKSLETLSKEACCPTGCAT